MSINFLLPMKGHSERIPEKNMKLFGGRPLYHSIMIKLLKSKYLNKIYVDTDSETISADLREFFPAVTIIERPAELCGDEVSMNRIIAHDLALIGEEHFLQTHSTNPLLSAETIDRAIEFYFAGSDKYDSVFSVNKIQSRLYSADGKAINHDPGQLIKTQDLSPVYEENSNFYVFSSTSFRNAGNRRIGKKPYMFVVSPPESIDIDTQSDFDLALYIRSFLERE